MRAASAIPAVGLLLGSMFGLLFPGVSTSIEAGVLLATTGLAVWAWWARRPGVLIAAVVGGFGAGGAVLSARAWTEAWQPPLRAAFEALAREARTEAEAERRVLPIDDSAAAEVVGVLTADAAPGATGITLRIAVEAISAPRDPEGQGRHPPLGDAPGGVIATVRGTLGAERLGVWRAGRRVRLPLALGRPSRYLDPGVPDHERDLARRGTILVGSVKSGALVEILAKGSPFDEAMGAVRAFARRAIRQAVGRWSERSAAIVAAIVIGDRAGLDEDVQRGLQEAGTYHVIAISGGNIAILAGLLLGVFRVGGVLGRTAMLAAIAALVAYADLVGGGASVDRATLMAVVYFASRAIDHRGTPLNILALVAACLVVIDPLSVLDPAFVLTFGATLAILVVVPVLAKRPAVVASLFVASAATEAVLFPVGAIVFSRVTFAGLVLNFAAIPLMAVTQVAGMMVVPVALASPWLAGLAGGVAHAGAVGLVQSAGLVRFVPWVTWRLASPSVGIVVFYYAALGIWWVLWRRRATVDGSGEPRAARAARRVAACAAAAAAVWILVAPLRFLTARGDGRLHVVFLDVGQGDATFVRFPRGSTMLVDAGTVSGSFNLGDRVVAPVLRDAGVRRLDYLVLTHGDPDHIGGMAAILREFRPREVWEGVSVPALEPLRALRADAERLGCRWRSVKAGDRWDFNGPSVIVRHPPPPDWERQRPRNDDAVVLDLAWNDVSVLLTSDIGAEAERTLGPALPRVAHRVLKVPHHGSRTSSAPEFISASAARVAIVSVGRSNRFGHPAPEVLARYQAAGVDVLRTDRDGAITLDTDGTGLRVRTFTGATRVFGPATALRCCGTTGVVQGFSPAVTWPEASRYVVQSPSPAVAPGKMTQPWLAATGLRARPGSSRASRVRTP